jgi:hypothetical protein
MSDYWNYWQQPDGTMRLTKIKGDPYDFYRCVGCWKIWVSTAKKMGHKEASCKKHR